VEQLHGWHVLSLVLWKNPLLQLTLVTVPPVQVPQVGQLLVAPPLHVFARV